MTFPTNIWDGFTRNRPRVDTVAGADAFDFEEIRDELIATQSFLLNQPRSLPIPLAAITREDGTALTKQATDVAGFAQLSNKEQVILIPVDCSAGEQLGFSAPLPRDLDTSKDISLKVLIGKATDLDALTLDAEAYLCAAGDVQNADAQSTAAMTITATPSVLTFTVLAASLLTLPSTLTAILLLGGVNDGDEVNIYGVWLEYAAKAA